MAVYATKADMISLYGEDYIVVGSDVDGDLSLDNDPVTNALIAASADIDQFIVQGGATPPATEPDAPDWFKWATVDIALYMLAPDGASSQEAKKERADYWRERLRAHYQPVDVNGNPVPTASDKPLLTAGERLFTRATMGGLL